MANESFARIKIDQLLKDADWSLADGRSVRFEYPLDDGGRVDYALFDRQDRALVVLEAKSTSVNMSAGEAQGGRYADQLGVPFIFLSNGEEVWFRDKPISADSRPCSVRTTPRAGRWRARFAATRSAFLSTLGSPAAQGA